MSAFSFTVKEKRRFCKIADLGNEEGCIDFSSLEIISWMIEINYKWSSHDLVLAFRGGNREIFDLLLRNGCPVSAALFSMAVEAGDFKVMLYLRERDRAWHDDCRVPLWLFWEAVDYFKDRK